MSGLVALAVALAGLSLGLRATSVLLDPSMHPFDRLALSILSGALIVAVIFQVAVSYRVPEAGLGLLVSLSPVGLFDTAKWWFRSRGRRANWLTSRDAWWLVALRWIGLAVGAAAIALMAL